MQADRRSKRVWERLIQCYGSRMAESYGPTLPKPWADAIEDLTDDQIAYGLRHVIRDSPIHPPSLGQFVRACQDLPVAKTEKGPSIQEQLVAYCALRFHGKQPIKDPIIARQFMLPWTFLYRQWTDPDKKGPLQNCAECVGVLIPAVEHLPEIRVMVIDMLADSDLHSKALRSFEPGPPPPKVFDPKAASKAVEMPA